MKALRYSSLLIIVAILLLSVVAYHLRAAADNEVPRVQLNTDNIAPRPIEDLTSKSVPRDYALAWQTLEQALEENQTGLLDGYFTGFAKQDFTQRINSQLKSGLHTRYTDRGHKLEALFYSPTGDVMELRDHAQLDMQILDGGKVIYDEPMNAEFTVLMTPGADRWLVRQIQATSGEKP
ncbi:MAG: hypothetical protein DMG92_08550 [Acidobacteria bacterium]|jgi:hypothetical protein|nr:MAG: hypothetical protein DMG92_08550 [Acidobacteriota bacterium]